ncbi:YwbE family protein [Candidatus Parcubacteria bacterium]|nr:MAG: YwbE family protein [Candidatus Parcubacteria bacterium]
MDPTIRKNIYSGQHVEIIQKQHQKTKELSQGIVKEILTNAAVHPRGIKVRLESGLVGRVQNIFD